MGATLTSSQEAGDPDGRTGGSFLVVFGQNSRVRSTARTPFVGGLFRRTGSKGLNIVKALGAMASSEGALAIRVGLVLAFLPGIATFLQRRQGGDRKWEGANVKKLAISLAVGWLLRFAVPIPDGVSKQGWSMLAIFASTIASVVLGPLPSAATTLVAVAAAVVTKTITFAEGTRAFTDEVVWMVLLAFWFAEAFKKTGLGQRLALSVIKAVGGTTLGVAYGLNAAELCVAAAMPSSVARSAAIFYPITTSISKASGSDPAEGSRKKCGAFLVECCYQATATSSCLFLTGTSQNFLILKLAAGVGVEIANPFTTWFMAALLPALVSFLLSPLLAYLLLEPEAKQMPDAPKAARQQLEAMGPPSDNERVLGSVILGMVGLWMASTALDISPVVTALCGVSILMVTGIITWDDCARNKEAWSTVVSFACLVSLASTLNALGIVQWLSSSIIAKITAAGLTDGRAFLVILASYWGVHYLFASQVAHVSVLLQPFLLMLVQTGTPPTAAFFALAFASNLFMTMTPYASAQSAVIMGGKYVSVGEWYKLGFAYFLFYFGLWVGIGYVWWRVIGLI